MTGAHERAAARLLGLWPAVAVAAVHAAVVAVVERAEGGLWLGDVPGRTDAAVHGWAELVQAPALVLAAGALGVAVGRAVRQRVAAAVVGAVVLSAFGFLSWAWQWSPARYVAPVQLQPFEVPLPAGTDASALPDSWLLAAPSEYDAFWRHLVVDQAVAGWHAAYLVGLALVFAGLAVRRRTGRPLLAVGLVVAAAGVASQVAALPAGA